MRINKKIIACSLFASLGISGFIFKTALADGGIMIWPPSIHVQQTDQNAIVAWNGTQELLVLSTNFTKPADSQNTTLLHVVPLPNKPSDIKEEDTGVFEKMVALLNEKIAAMQAKNLNMSWGSGGTANSTAPAAAPSVEVVLQKTIGAHDITVVKVNVADDFSNWIDGFASGKNLAAKQISDNFKAGLQSYLKRGINYFAFDVLDLTDQSTTVKPLVYQFDTKYFYFPLLISGISEIGDSQTNINLFLVFSKDWKLPTNIWQDYGSNYYIDDSRLDIGLTNDELKGISARTAGLFSGDVKVRRFSMRGTLSNINKDLMLFPRLFSSNLKIGMRNDDVKILQQLLINEGFWNSNASVSSYFGPVTKQAVMLFQQKNNEQILKPLGLTGPTGFFGPYTRNYLNNNIFIDFGTGPSTILCGNGKCDTGLGETAASCPADCTQTSCVPEGGHILTKMPTSERCCDGLKSMSQEIGVNAAGACDIEEYDAGITCTNCGNGICGTGENKCNCPEDCGKIVGGACSYKEFPGKCTIVNPVLSDGVNYTFVPTGSVDISGTFLTSASQINPYNGSTTSFPEPIIGVGKSYDCTLKVEKSGTCTPIIVVFTGPICGKSYIDPLTDDQRAGCAKAGGIVQPTTIPCPSGGCSHAYYVCNCAKCGNGICDTGETTASCPQDCGNTKSCIAQGGACDTSYENDCCPGLVCMGFGQSTTGKISFSCAKNPACGNGKCDVGETGTNCPQDCASSACAAEGEIFDGNSRVCCAGTYMVSSNMQMACQIGTACNPPTYYTCRKITCGDGVCSAGEKCLRDCPIVDGQMLLGASGYGFTLGDIVTVKSGLPQKGDIIYYNEIKNNSMCMAMGSGVSLGRVKGVPGDTVTFSGNYITVGTERIQLSTDHWNSDKDFSKEPAVFNGIKYQSLAGISITLGPGEYLMDNWVGTQCFTQDTIGQSSKGYNRFTVDQAAIIGVVGTKVGHDTEYENATKNIVY